MQKLIQGIHQFQQESFRPLQGLFEQLAKGQNPETLFITCSDSRIDPTLLTKAQTGDLFIPRNAGNIVPPHGAANGGEAATIEFAVVALGVKNIIICGHSHCGAMKGLLHPDQVASLPAVASWLSNAETTRRIVRENYRHLDGDRLLTATVEENVLVQLENLRTLPDLTLGGNAVVANGSGLVLTVGSDANGGPAVDLLDGSDPTNVTNFLTRFAMPTTPNDIAIGAGIAFVADGSSGLQVVNYVPFDTRGVPPTASISVPGAAIDPNTGNLQVIEGSSISVHADVHDDVQVRKVELLVNGQVVENAVSLPLNLSFTAPKITDQPSTVTVQIQATDTGGNSTLSNLLTINLVPDTLPAQIISIDPADGSVRGEGCSASRSVFPNRST